MSLCTSFFAEGPLGPGAPREPSNPGGPGIPTGPGAPGSPLIPLGPLGPGGPGGPRGPTRQIYSTFKHVTLFEGTVGSKNCVVISLPGSIVGNVTVIDLSIRFVTACRKESTTGQRRGIIHKPTFVNFNRNGIRLNKNCPTMAGDLTFINRN